jgi:hypothetical protein
MRRASEKNFRAGFEQGKVARVDRPGSWIVVERFFTVRIELIVWRNE